MGNKGSQFFFNKKFPQKVKPQLKGKNTLHTISKKNRNNEKSRETLFWHNNNRCLHTFINAFMGTYSTHLAANCIPINIKGRPNNKQKVFIKQNNCYLIFIIIQKIFLQFESEEKYSGLETVHIDINFYMRFDRNMQFCVL